jgi:predicted RNA-binding protein with PUA-like domain
MPNRSAPATRRYWLVKSEPDVFSFDDLWNAPRRTTYWDGVRNYQARNFMRDEMKLGDGVLFYHSGSETPAVVGVAEVVREAYADHTAFDRAGPHYDPKSKPDAPTWVMVDLRATARFHRPVPLPLLRETPRLAGMELLRRGSRLSVQPVTPEQWDIVCRLGSGEKPEGQGAVSTPGRRSPRGPSDSRRA